MVVPRLSQKPDDVDRRASSSHGSVPLLRIAALVTSFLLRAIGLLVLALRTILPTLFALVSLLALLALRAILLVAARLSAALRGAARMASRPVLLFLLLLLLLIHRSLLLQTAPMNTGCLGA